MGDGMDLPEHLQQYTDPAGGHVPMHMPGHKRRAPFSLPDPYTIDITEIEGFDDLHHPKGILKEAQEEAARICGSRETFFLVNGSTGGILAAIGAACAPGDHILAARNCHRSVFHACEIGGLRVHTVEPMPVPGFSVCGSVSPLAVEAALAEAEAAAQTGAGTAEQKDNAGRIRAVVITSPTYEGVVSDVAAIARAAHAHGAVLIVDEAHGAHLTFAPQSRPGRREAEEAYANAGWCDVIPACRDDAFPASALACGADIVIQSLHKTLPALTQTALLHTGQDCPVTAEQLQRQLSVYQTSSPSYVLMASIEQCLRWMDREGREETERFEARLARMTLRMSARMDAQAAEQTDAQTAARTDKRPDARPRRLRAGLPGVYAFDPSKVYIESRAGGDSLARALRARGIEPEMVTARGVLLMTTLMDGEEELDRLAQTLAGCAAEAAREHAAEEAGKSFAEAAGQAGRERVGDRPVKPDRECASGAAGQNFAETAGENARAGEADSAAGIDLAAALRAARETVRLKESIGRVSADYVYCYPPGVPILLPGERVTAAAAEKIRQALAAGLDVHGLDEHGPAAAGPIARGTDTDGADEIGPEESGTKAAGPDEGRLAVLA